MQPSALGLEHGLGADEPSVVGTAAVLFVVQRFTGTVGADLAQHECAYQHPGQHSGNQRQRLAQSERESNGWDHQQCGSAHRALDLGPGAAEVDDGLAFEFGERPFGFHSVADGHTGVDFDRRQPAPEHHAEKHRDDDHADDQRQGAKKLSPVAANARFGHRLENIGDRPNPTKA